MTNSSLTQVEEAHRVLRRLRGARWNVTREVTEIQRSLHTAHPADKKVTPLYLLLPP